ncbi:MAG: phosphatidylglycerophosphate synthase [Ilumatobacter sp.]|jgi:phosphatidylglycerophosphate synthase
MLDSMMRPVKDRLLAPLISTPLIRLHPSVISAIGLAFSLGAATAAWRQIPLLAVALWMVGRIADGVDGLAARATGRASDTGGLLDFVFDTIGYAAIPIGLAFGLDDRLGWIATAVLLASFYLNAVSLGYIAALLEKHALGAAATGQPTSAVLPRGLIEGTETIVFFTIALAFPDAATTVWWIMAALVTVTALERVRWAHGRLS